MKKLLIFILFIIILAFFGWAGIWKGFNWIYDNSWEIIGWIIFLFICFIVLSIIIGIWIGIKKPKQGPIDEEEEQLIQELEKQKMILKEMDKIEIEKIMNEKDIKKYNDELEGK